MYCRCRMLTCLISSLAKMYGFEHECAALSETGNQSLGWGIALALVFVNFSIGKTKMLLAPKAYNLREFFSDITTPTQRGQSETIARRRHVVWLHPSIC